MWRLLLIIAIWTGVLWGGSVGADDAFDKAYAAYNRGNYAEALDGFRVLAEQGNARAGTTSGSCTTRAVAWPRTTPRR
jgi:hypothetical protein